MAGQDVAWVLPKALALAPAAGEVRGNCLACHVVPGGPFRYPVPGSAELDLLRISLSGIALVFFIAGVAGYIARWTRGGQRLPLDRLGSRLRSLLVNGLLQRRVLRQWPGLVVHLPIYLGSLLLIVSGIIYLASPGSTRYPSSTVFTAFRVTVNLGFVLLVAGILAAMARRLLKVTPGLHSGAGDWLVLVWLLLVAFTGAVLDATTALAHNPGGIPAWDISGRLLEPLLAQMSVYNFLWLHRATQIVHLVLTLLLLGLLPYTKLAHIVTGGVFNTFYARQWHPSSPPPVPDAEERIERGESIGVVRLADTSWKQRMDYDACVHCARCRNACPALATGKPLSPMKLILTMRDQMDRGNWDGELVPAVIKPETVWSCVTCGACVYNCPVLVNHVETVIDLRRGLVSRGEHVPEELLQVSYNLMRTGNPYGANPYEKEEWLRSLVEKGLVEEAQPGVEYDYILWVGCANAYDPRLRGVVESTLRLAKRAGLRVAVIMEQQCCGDPARRIGDELMFIELVKSNAEMLSQYRFKRLLVTCPHGYNVFKNDYPKYGVKLEVEHHSQLLARLLASGRLKPARKLGVAATYHDPCYLGRWNSVYEEPRSIVRASVRELREMPRSREKSFCCGGGGGGAFYDIKIGQRLSRVRAEEAANTGAKVLAVACPFCNIMLSAEAPDYGLEVRDVAELLDEATREGEG